MGRLFLVASIAMLAMSGPSDAKPARSKHGSGTASRFHDGPIGYGSGGCPPGLKNKNAACKPPGRYKKLFEIGERVPGSYKGLIRYNGLPYEVRMAYGGALDPKARYIYDRHYIYRIDPVTMIVRQTLRPLP